MKKKLLVDVSDFCFNGNLLKQLRARKRYSAAGFRHSKGSGASKTQIAKRIGCHPQQVMRWERYPHGGDCPAAPNLKMFKKICLLFQIDPIKFIGMKWLYDKDAFDFERGNIKEEERGHFCPLCGNYVGYDKDIFQGDD